MTAEHANKLRKKHLDKLQHPVISDIYPFIRKSAELGGTHLNYGVLLNANVSHIINVLKNDHFKVSTKLQDTLLVLEISWE